MTPAALPTTPGLFPRKMSLIITDKGGVGIDLGSLSSKFQISRSAGGAIGLAKITVFNLSDTTIGKLQGKYTRIQLDAGYPQRFGTIFKGEVRNVFPTRDGPDKVVEIFAADGASAYEQSVVCLCFPAGSSLIGVVQSVAATFVGIEVGSLEALTDRAIVGAVSFSKMTRDAMNELAESYHFRWSIQGGILQVIDVGRLDPKPSLEISRETGMIDSPLASTNGVEVLTLLDHRIIPGRRVDVISAGAQLAVTDSTLSLSKKFKVRGREFRQFDVLRVTHVGESRGQTWYTKAFALPAGIL